MTTRPTLDSRETILERIRASVGADAESTDRRVAIQKRLYDHASHIIPERAQQTQDALLRLFQDKLEGQSATVRHAAAIGDVPRLLADYLREHNLPARVRHGLDERLAQIDWSIAPQIDRLTGSAHPDDVVGLSHAFAGASETGTLFLVSGDANPTTVNFLPETHVVVVRASDILGSYEGVWERIRDAYGERTMPRTVNLISGPSRTADIEQTLIMGAHGPKRMLVIIVGN